MSHGNGNDGMSFMKKLWAILGELLYQYLMSFLVGG